MHSLSDGNKGRCWPFHTKHWWQVCNLIITCSGKISLCSLKYISATGMPWGLLILSVHFHLLEFLGLDDSGTSFSLRYTWPRLRWEVTVNLLTKTTKHRRLWLAVVFFEKKENKLLVQRLTSCLKLEERDVRAKCLCMAANKFPGFGTKSMLCPVLSWKLEQRKRETLFLSLWVLSTIE